MERDKIFSIELTVTPKIFMESTKIKKRFEEILSEPSELFISHLNEINDFLKSEERGFVAELPKVFEAAQYIFRQEIMEDAITMSLCEGKYNIEDNILELLSEDYISDLIMGEPMILAIQNSDCFLPSDEATFLKYLDYKMSIALIREHFLGEPATMDFLDGNLLNCLVFEAEDDSEE